MHQIKRKKQIEKLILRFIWSNMKIKGKKKIKGHWRHNEGPLTT